jgi:D-alanyl-D-alanine carboxypeptidase
MGRQRLTLYHQNESLCWMMQKNLFVALTVFFLSLCLAASHAYARESYIVIEAKTGTVLLEDDADAVRYPASLTKMMTLYLTFEAVKNKRFSLKTRLPVSAFAAAQSPSKLGFKKGQTITVEQCILGLVTQSANDAAVVLAEALGGSEVKFARIMTHRAYALGMKRTNFRNASGLPNESQVTTAREFTILSRALLNHFPEYYHYFSRKSFTYGRRTHQNHNHLMKEYAGMDGIKTGYIRASGFNLAASARRNGLRLIAIYFGGDTARERNAIVERLLDRGFDRASRMNFKAMATTHVPMPSRKPQAEAESEIAEGDADDPAPVDNSLGSQKNAATLNQQQIAMLTAPTAPPPPSSVSQGKWGIQIGAYADPAISQKAVTDIKNYLPGILSGTTEVIEPIQVQNMGMTKPQTLYRTRLMGLTETSSRSACLAMMSRGQQCWLVPAPVAPTVITQQ